MGRKKPPSLQGVNHLVSHQLAKSNFFQSQQLNTGVLDGQPPKSLRAEHLSDSGRISTGNVRNRGYPVSNSQSKVQQVDQKPEPEQEESQGPNSVRERLIGCILKDPSTLVFFLFVLIYLACATIRFVHTDDGAMLVTLLPYAAGYVGIPMVTPHIPWGKKEGNN